MELFRSGLKSVLGSPEPVSEPSGADTVERLLERLRSSSLLEDRRDACRGLKAMSKKYRVDVGAQGMSDLIAVTANFGNDGAGDPESIGLALDTLCNVTAQGIINEEDDLSGPEVGDQFTEILIKTPGNVEKILALLAEFEFRVRFPAVRLLTNLLQNRARDVQDIVIVSPQGVSRMMDLLNDPREVVRNDALIMLAHLIKGNANLQKIVAFENAFDRLCDVISEEGAVNGGIVVEDCLVLMLGLLKNNASNQSFFREGSYIQRLTKFFETLAAEEHEADSSDLSAGWSAQKVSNVHHLLQVVRTLVSPTNSKQETAAAQKLMRAGGLLALLCELLMSAGVPADVLTECINTVAEVCRGCLENQRYLCGVCAPSTPPRPVLVVLLMSMVNERQPLALRCAVLYCFQCHLHNNAQGQRQLVQTLLPAEPVATPNDGGDVTAGHLLCTGLFTGKPLSMWFSAVALSHALVNSAEQRSELLRVQLATSAGEPAVTLLYQLLIILQQQTPALARLGLLQLLTMWMAGCTPAVNQLLQQPPAVPYFMSQLSSNESDDLELLCQGACAFIVGLCVMLSDDSCASLSRRHLIQLVERRVGVEPYLSKLGHLAKHELYSRSLKHPQLCARDRQQLALDHEFCRLFKALEPAVISALTGSGSSTALPISSLDGGELSGVVCPELTESHPVQHYQQLIREQDQQLAEFKRSESTLCEQLSQKCQEVEQLSTTVEQLRDQITLLRAQKVQVTPSAMSTCSDTESSVVGHFQMGGDSCLSPTDVLRRQYEQQLMDVRTSYDQQLTSLTDEIARLSQALSQEQTLTDGDDDNGDESSDRKDELSSLRRRLAELELRRNNCNNGHGEDVGGNESANGDGNSMQQRLATLTAENHRLSSELASSESEKQQLGLELSETRREQDDLLVLLTDQESRLENYRQQLAKLGVHVSEDDE